MGVYIMIMNKFIFSALFLILSLSFLASAADVNLEIVSVTPLPISGKPGDTLDIQVAVQNVGSTTINAVNVVSTDLTSTVGSSIIQKPIGATILSLAPDTSKTAVLKLTLPIIAAGSYGGIISVSDVSDGIQINTNGDYIVTVNVIDGITITTESVTVTGQEDQIVTATVSIQNTGSTSYQPTFAYTQTDFSDNDKNVFLTFSGPGTLNPGQIGTATITADIEDRIDIDTYTGIITVTGGTTAQDTFELNVKVHPEVCQDGVVGDELSLDINEPDSGDDFAPGDIINIDVTADNDGSSAIDVVVEAFLYNVDQDQEIARVEADALDIDDGDNDDFQLDLEIPFSDDISEDDEYILFIKAFEDGDEDKQCAQEDIDLEIQRENHDVRIEGVSLIPSSAKPGEFVDVSVSYINVGSNNEDDVFVRLNVPELGWDETSTPVDLDDGESNDNDGTARFTVRIPDNTAAGTYSVLATITFDDGDGSNDEFATLTVLEGTGVIPGPGTTGDSGTLRIQSVSDSGDNTFALSVVATNDGATARTYDVSISANWAQEITPQTFTLNGGDSRVVQFSVAAQEDTETGSYTGTITLEEDGNTVDTETFTVGVTQETTRPSITGFSISNLFGGTTGTVLFILADIVLIIIAIFFIKLIFGSGKRRNVPKAVEKVKL